MIKNICNIHSNAIRPPYGVQLQFGLLHICVHVWHASHHRNFIGYIYFIKLNIKCGKMNEYYLIWISIDFKLWMKASFFFCHRFSHQSNEQDWSWNDCTCHIERLRIGAFILTMNTTVYLVYILKHYLALRTS